MTSVDDDFLQYLFNRLNEGYEEYKRNHPDFAKVVEEQLEGKTEEDLEESNYGTGSVIKKRTHCESCGEWLQGFHFCDQCGRINK